VKSTYTFVLALFTCATLATPCQSTAQTLSNTSTIATLTTWDSAAVITVSGSIESIVSQHVAGTPGGFNIVVNSVEGELYANLGSHPSSQLARQLTGGQFLTLSGIIRTGNGRKYLLVRTLNLNGQNFVVRNALGIPMKSTPMTSPSTRVRQGSFGGAR
jgi:hypothetical protein